MTIQLVLSHYLGGLKERNELDALLPELLRAMGHSVRSRAQLGVGQGGVDVLSTCKTTSGENEVFMFIIKFGNIGRTDLFNGDQAIVPTVREASTLYVRSRLPRPLHGLRKHLILLTNGTLKQEAQEGYAALVAEVAQNTECDLDMWGLDQLAPLIEQHLFSEALLLEKGKADLRAAIAGLEDSDSAVRRFVRFAAACFDDAVPEARQSKPARKKRFVRQCSAAMMGWVVLLVWCRGEGNLKPGVVAGEYVALRMWSEAVELGLTREKAFGAQLARVMELLAEAHIRYFEKVLPQLLTPRAVLGYRPLRPLYTQLVFEEMGRLAVLILLLPPMPHLAELRSGYKRRLIELLNAHPGCRLPTLDGQAVDLSLALAALMSCGDHEAANAVAVDVVQRFAMSLASRRHRPIDTDVLEDAVSVDFADDEEAEEYFRTSTLLPMLGTALSLCNDQGSLDKLNNEVTLAGQGLTLERWYPQTALEALARTGRRVQEVGISRVLQGFRKTCAEELDASVAVPRGAAAAEEFQCVQVGCEVLLAVSARLNRHPLPTWLLASYGKRQGGVHAGQPAP